MDDAEQDLIEVDSLDLVQAAHDRLVAGDRVASEELAGLLLDSLFALNVGARGGRIPTFSTTQPWTYCCAISRCPNGTTTSTSMLTARARQSANGSGAGDPF